MNFYSLTLIPDLVNTSVGKQRCKVILANIPTDIGFLNFISEASYEEGGTIMELSEIFAVLLQPTSIVAYIAIIISVIAAIKVRKVKFTPKLIALIGVVLALSTVLSLIVVYRWPQAGSITLGSMVPIIILSIVYGPEVGFVAGFLFGIINLIVDPQVYYPIQALFDYPLAYMSLGLAGFFKKNKLLAPIPAILGRFIFHYLSGVIFFASYAPEGQSPYIYSAVYNASYLVPEMIIAIVVLAFIPLANIVKGISTSNTK